MRTIRDNYYIITGHTYEEYCKKYRHGIGKGKLLSFTEEEAKYLKKNKFYWEVIGPDGKTLYCQVHKVKPKHVIIPLVIAGVIGGGTAAGVIYLPKLFKKFDGQVTETQWKDAMENITHVNDLSRKLNYKTNSNFTVVSKRSGNETKIEYKNLIVDGDLEEVTESDTGKTVYMYEYKHLPLQSYDGENVTVASSMLRDSFAFLFGDFYSTMSSFTYDKESKCYNYTCEQEEVEGGLTLKDVNSSISFESTTHIKKVTCSYIVYQSGKEVDSFDGSFEYEYGTASLKDWGKEFEGILQKRTLSASSSVSLNQLTIDENNDLVSKDTALDPFVDQQALIVSLDYTKETLPKGLRYFKLMKDTEEITFWPNRNSIKIFKNGILLEHDVDWKFTFRSTDKYVVGFELMENLTSSDILTVKFAFSDYLTAGCKLVISSTKK